MKFIPSLQLATLAALLVAGRVFAQAADVTNPDGAGLLGYKYTGVDFGYIHHVESAPDSMQRYGFIAQAPLPEMVRLDGAFAYDLIRGSDSGITTQTHRARVSLVRYFSHRTARPFVDAGIGWAWGKTGSVKEDSFYYRGMVGAELGINPNLTLTPFVSVEEAANLGDRAWNIGARLAWRLDRNWIPAIRIQVDDKHNIEFGVGMAFRY